MTGNRIMSDAQLALGKVAGLKTNSESRVIAGGAAETVVIYDSYTSKRRPVYIRVRNLGTEPIYVSEDLRGADLHPIASAKQFTDVLAADTGSAATLEKGGGAGCEWDLMRPSCIALFGTNAWRAVVVIRYIDEN